MARGNLHDPARCKVTVYTCCPREQKPSTNKAPEEGHQCHNEPVKDGLCIKHLGDRSRLLKPM